MIVEDLIISMPQQRDTLDVHPRGGPCVDLPHTIGHVFICELETAGYKYKICGRCGTVRITEVHG